MKKSTLLPLLFTFAFADIYQELSNFAYEKKPNQNIKVRELKLIEFTPDKEKCLELLIDQEQIRILRSFNSCKVLERDERFKNFLEKDFFSLYQSDDSTMLENVKRIKNIMQNIMVHYKLRRTLGENMSPDPNLTSVQMDENKGGTLAYKINDKACVYIELFRKEDKMTMKVYGTKDPDGECRVLVNSPQFKEFSLVGKEPKFYPLE